MNKNKLKSYAQKARREFIQAVTDRAHFYGLKEHSMAPCEVKGDFAIINGKPFPKRVANQRNKLEERINQNGYAQVMENIAYTWFNRFVAIRYMELHGFLSHGYRVLSHPSDENLPEILEKAQYVELTGLDKDEVINLKMDGTKDDELYRLLLVAQCNELSNIMPFLFEEVADCTELLLPDNLLHSNSLIRKMVSEINEEDWQKVEIIGWLYQFYISEKKDQVIGKVVKSEDIPAATQLFTPNWIVKYMVQNSLGAQWMRTYPDSSLKNKMEYYIEPAEQTDEVKAQLKEITPSSLNPEELTLLDPACGSGHILVEAYDLLKEIYLERGYRKRDIPQLILTKNLYGLEIDDRAAQLAGFALMMKAREDNRQIFDHATQPTIVSIQESNGIDKDSIIQAVENTLYRKTSNINPGHFKFVDSMDSPLLTETDNKSTITKNLSSEIKALLYLFEDAKTFGSLIRIPERLANKLPEIEAYIEEIEKGDDLFKIKTLESLKPFISQAKLLSRRYDAVIANPPYMGRKGMNSLVKDFAKDQYPETKSDLFAMFIERGFELAKDNTGNNAMITMESWMFLSSYETLRKNILTDATIVKLIHMPYEGRGRTSLGINFGTSAFVFKNIHINRYKANFIYIRYFEIDQQGVPLEFPIRNERLGTSVVDDFKKIPGSPIAYWVSDKVREVFERGKELRSIFDVKQGMATSDNNRFLRIWYEVSFLNTKFDCNSLEESKVSNEKWYPYNKGGDFRLWYGNNEHVVNWQYNGKELKEFQSHLNQGWHVRLKSREFYFKPSISWSFVSSAYFGVRYSYSGFIFDVGGSSAFPPRKDMFFYVGFLCTKLVFHFLKALNPTLNFQVENVNTLPVLLDRKDSIQNNIDNIVSKAIALSQQDWDLFETSWDFEEFPLLSSQLKLSTIKQSFVNWEKQCKINIATMKELEEENNRIFIEAYGLQDELTPNVPDGKITLARADKENDIKRLISYAVGCMTGRYSLDVKGLVYAHSGNEGFDYSKYTTFPADDDGIIPITDTEWFDDDAACRFFRFIEVAWSKETLEDNLEFIATSTGQKTNESARDAIRRYFVSSFFKDHLKTYKKRPIYWLFTTGKQKAFQALVYLHRYNEGTLSRMRTEYVLPLQSKMTTRLEHLDRDKDHASSTSAANKIQKEIDKLRKQKEELRLFDEKLRHYADMKIKLDLDDGVKVNYGKFGDLLSDVKAVTGKKE